MNKKVSYAYQYLSRTETRNIELQAFCNRQVPLAAQIHCDLLCLTKSGENHSPESVQQEWHNKEGAPPNESAGFRGRHRDQQ